MSSKSDVGANLDLSESPAASPATKEAPPVEKPAKMIPVKRTRFRSRDNRKIVLKRRKVKRLRARPRKVGLAPEAGRGGSLAELALATLSAEELSAELSRDRKAGGGGRDIQIMKIFPDDLEVEM